MDICVYIHGYNLDILWIICGYLSMDIRVCIHGYFVNILWIICGYIFGYAVDIF